MKTAVVALVRNEAPDLAEWIALHLHAGFDTVLILDHQSTDATAEVALAASRFHDVRLIRTPGARTQGFQCSRYDWVCQSVQDEFDWLLFIDSDEFLLFSDKALRVNEFLTRFDGWSGIAVNWAVIGSNGHAARPKGLVIDSFTRRAPAEFFPNRHVKSFVRPDAVVRAVNPHYFDLLPGEHGQYCDPSGQPTRWLADPCRPGDVVHGLTEAVADYAVCRINHYFTRSRAHWEAKVSRGRPGGGAPRTDNDFIEHDRNDTLDPSALAHYWPVSKLANAIQASMAADCGADLRG